jgi:serine/threonine protein kinase
MKADAFLAVLAKSRLLTPEQLDEARDATLLTDDAEALSQILIDQGLLTGWQTDQLLAGRTSFFVGNYVLLELLGRGGMGSVFLAKHIKMNRRAALKIVSKKVGKDPDSLQQFLTEARATASLDHPNIVRAYDVDREGDHFYIVMEYVPGNTLDEIVELDGPLEFEFIANCIRQAADGLAHAHGRNMVHCDIKPSNLLVTDDDVVKVLDMGMARLVGGKNDGASTPRDHRVLGTVDYMAPEQAIEGPAFDHRADIYSLGCTLYFALTGQPPFNEGTLTQRILKHQTQEPPDIRELRPDAPDELVAICRKMMAKDPRDRYQSAAEVSRVLADWRPREDDAAEELVETVPAAIAAESSLAVALDREGVAAAPKLPPPPAKPKGVFDDERKLVMVMAAVAAGAAVVVAIVVLAIGVLFSDSTTEVVEDAPAPSAQDVAPAPEPPQQPSPGKQPRKPDAAKPTPTPPSIAPTPEKSPWNDLASILKPEPKPSEPLAELVGAVNLPDLEPAGGGRRPAGAAVSLGNVRLGDPGALKVELVGGGAAVGGGKRFLLLPDKGSWRIRFADAEGNEADAARVRLERDALMFQWLETSDAMPLENLRNCMFNVTAGKTTRTVQLSTPEAVEPVVLDFLEGVAKRTISLPYPPDSGALRLKVTSVEGPFGKLSFTPGDTIAADGRMEIVLTADKTPKIALRVSYSVRGRTTEVDVSTYYQLADEKRLSRFSRKAVGALEKNFDRLQTLTNNLAANLANQQGKINPQTTSLRQRLDAANAELAELKSLYDLCNAAHGSAKLYFRQFIAADGSEIELSTAAKPPAAPEPEPPS